jgi:hypothetical protein
VIQGKQLTHQGKTLFMKKLTVSGKNITGLAYHDGNGGVTLGLTTCEDMQHWDLVLEDPKGAKHQMGKEKLLCLKKIPIRKLHQKTIHICSLHCMSTTNREP